MSYKYNPTVTDLRNCYEVAYGEQGIYMLYGAFFANASSDVIERLYQDGIEKVREDMRKAGQL
jgi:hypothetical protein